MRTRDAKRKSTLNKEIAICQEGKLDTFCPHARGARKNGSSCGDKKERSGGCVSPLAGERMETTLHRKPQKPYNEVKE